MSKNASRSSPAGSPSYRGVCLALLAASALGTATIGLVGWRLGVATVLDAAGVLFLSTGMLAGVSVLRRRGTDAAPAPASDEPGETTSTPSAPPVPSWRTGSMPRVVALVGALALGAALATQRSAGFGRVPAVVGMASLLIGAGMAATAARYLAGADAERFPEASRLARAARVLGWVLILAAISVGLVWQGLRGAHALHWVVLAVVALALFELLTAERRLPGAGLPTDLAVFRALGSRPNPLASLGDAVQQQLGIDVRSTWAVGVVRRSVEPLLVVSFGLGWLSTALTVLGVEEVGLLEHFGVPAAAPPLGPGLHVHWPWPVDRVVRVPAHRMQVLAVGHEGEEEEEPGPENVLWARQHSDEEYTLLLGDGRDLIAVDAAVRFRIRDPHAWRYRLQNPADALSAIAYRAVMKATVVRTLDQALSQNVALLTEQMREAVQADADELGLGVDVIGFTVGGLHPPVRVAPAYQAVVSASLRKTTAAIDSQAYRNGLVPAAEAEVIERRNAALAAGTEALGKAVGEATGFRALGIQYRQAPEEFCFRRRLEVLESQLRGAPFTVIDARIERDGGELWLTR